MEVPSSSQGPRHSTSSQVFDFLVRQETSIAAAVGQSTHWLLDHSWFKGTIFAAVFINTIQMGVEVDNPEWTDVWSASEHVYTSIFVSEMVVKLSVLRLQYFRDRMNILDAAVALLAVVDVWILSVVYAGDLGLQALTIFRILRLFRLLRVLKMAKDQKHIMLVLKGVWEAMHAAMWVGVVIIAALYVGAVFCVRDIGSQSGGMYPGYSEDPDVIDQAEFMENFNPYLLFGNMAKSMLTLFNIATLSEWPEILRPIMVKQPQYTVFFCFFALFITFGAMNVIIGMVVDNVERSAVEFQNRNAVDDIARKRQVLQQIYDVWAKMGHSRDISLESLKGCESDGLLQSLITQADLPKSFSSEDMFELLDDNGDGTLQEAELFKGFFQLLEGGEFQHICLLKKAVNGLKSQLHAHQIWVKEELERHHVSLLGSLRLADDDATSRLEQAIAPKQFRRCPSATPQTPSMHWEPIRGEASLLTRAQSHSHAEIPPVPSPPSVVETLTFPPLREYSGLLGKKGDTIAPADCDFEDVSQTCEASMFEGPPRREGTSLCQEGSDSGASPLLPSPLAAATAQKSPPTSSVIPDAFLPIVPLVGVRQPNVHSDAPENIIWFRTS